MKRGLLFMVFLVLILLVVGCTSEQSSAPAPTSASLAGTVAPTQPLPSPTPTLPPPTATATPEPVAVPLDAENLAQAEVLLIFPLEGEDDIPYDVAFSPDGSLLAAGLTDGRVIFWRLPDGETVHTIAAHTERIFDIAFSPDGSLLATAGEDGMAKVIDVAEGMVRFTVTIPEEASKVHGVAFTADGTRLVTVSSEGPLGDHGVLRFWSVEDGSPLGTLGEPQWGALSMVGVSSQGKWLAAGYWENNQVRVWKEDEGEPVYTLTPQEGDWVAPIGGLAFSPDETLLAVPTWGEPGGKVYVWSLTDGSLRFVLEGHTHGHVYRVAFSPTGDLLISSGGDHTARFWSMADGALLRTLEFARNAHGVAWAPDGVWVAVATSETVEVWGLK